MNLHFLSVEEVACALRLHPETVRRYIREGKIRSYKIGKRKLIREEEIAFFAKKCTPVNITDK